MKRFGAVSLLSLAILGVGRGQALAAEPLPASGVAIPQLVTFDAAMQQYMGERSIKAGTLAVMKNGRILLQRGYGWKDAALQTPLPPDALMRFASVAKPITASAIGNLIRQGKLSASDRVFSLPGSPGLLAIEPFGTPDPRLKDITVQNLLDHKGGWDRDISGDLTWRPFNIATALGIASPPSKYDVARYATGQILDHTPGTTYAYSNLGYMLLGLVIERVTGKPYMDYIQQDLLQSIGIRNTEMQAARSLPLARNSREPWYSDPGNVTSVFDPTTVVPYPDGGFCIEARDSNGGIIGSGGSLSLFLKHYWISGEPRRGIWLDRNLTFFGSQPGTTSMVRQRPDGISLVALFNQRTDPSGLEYSTPLQKALDAAADSIGQWPRVAQPDEATGNQNTPLTVQVLDNDSDGADLSNPLRVVRVETNSETHGTVSINPDGSLLFVPETDYFGPSTWIYTMSDGALETSASVTVQVAAVKGARNRAPVAQPQSITTPPQTPVTITLAARDADDDAVRFLLLSNPAHGTLSANGDGSFTYTPARGFSGEDSFLFAAFDNKSFSKSAKVSLQVGSASPST